MLVATPHVGENYIYLFPTQAGYFLAEGIAPIVGGNVILPSGSALDLTTTEWLQANFWSPAQILAAAQAASMLRRLPLGPNEAPHS